MSAKSKPQHRICSQCQGWFVLQGKPLKNQRYYGGHATCPQCAGNPENPDRYILAERVEMQEVERMGRAMMLGYTLDIGVERLDKPAAEVYRKGN